MILVIGATGTNGKELVRQLIQKGQQVKAMVRNLEKASDLKQQGVSLVEGDLANIETIKNALIDTDKVFLVSSVNQDYEEQITNFLEAAKASDVKYLIKLSGLGADSSSPSVIMRMHAKTDEMIVNSGINYTILRPNSFHQNTIWSAYTIKNFNSFSMPVGDAKQSFIDVRDIGAVATTLLTTDNTEHKGKIYELTGNESLSFAQVAEIFSKALDRTITYNPITIEESREGMVQFGVPEWNALAVAEIYGVFATGSCAYTTDNVTKITGDTPITFSQFVQDHLAVFQ